MARYAVRAVVRNTQPFFNFGDTQWRSRDYHEERVIEVDASTAERATRAVRSRRHVVDVVRCYLSET